MQSPWWKKKQLVNEGMPYEYDGIDIDWNIIVSPDGTIYRWYKLEDRIINVRVY
jgi:hypothetical protein